MEQPSMPLAMRLTKMRREMSDGMFMSRLENEFSGVEKNPKEVEIAAHGGVTGDFFRKGELVRIRIACKSGEIDFADGLGLVIGFGQRRRKRRSPRWRCGRADHR